jgi:hypothetical protein
MNCGGGGGCWLGWVVEIGINMLSGQSPDKSLHYYVCRIFTINLGIMA